MNETELYERLRAVDPAAGVDADPRSPAAHRVRRLARHQRIPPATYSGFPRKRVIVLMAATLMLLTTSIAIATGTFQADPKDVSTILDEYADAEDVHGEGWRPELATELVWCLYEDGRGVQTTASEFPLDEPLTKERIIAACATGNDLVRGRRDVTTQFTLCEGLVPADDIVRVLDGTKRIVEGSLDANRYRFPIVLGWDANCASTALDTWPVPELRNLTSVGAINQARQIEISLRAAAIQRCLTRDEAQTLAGQARSRLQDQWPIVETPDNPRCHEVTMSNWGLLEVR